MVNCMVCRAYEVSTVETILAGSLADELESDGPPLCTLLIDEQSRSEEYGHIALTIK